MILFWKNIFNFLRAIFVNGFVSIYLMVYSPVTTENFMCWTALENWLSILMPPYQKNQGVMIKDIYFVSTNTWYHAFSTICHMFSRNSAISFQTPQKIICPKKVYTLLTYPFINLIIWNKINNKYFYYWIHEYGQQL